MKEALLLTIYLLLVGGCSVSTQSDFIRRTDDALKEYMTGEGYVKWHPNTDENIKNCILSGQITIGMTKEQVFASWGKPWRIHKSVGSWGIHEQWRYGHYFSSGSVIYYLHFENGILTSWQKY